MADEFWIEVNQPSEVVDRAGKSVVGHLNPGAPHRAIGSNEHWFMVPLPDGTTGFVPRTRARIVDGPPSVTVQPPEPVPEVRVKADSGAAGPSSTPSPNRCSNCGDPLQKDDLFCGRCGARVTLEQPQTRRPTDPQPPSGPTSEPPGLPPSPAPAASGARRGGGRGWIIALVVVLVAGAAGWYYFVRDDTLVLAEGEVFLEPANDPGPESFTTALDVPDTPEIINAAPVLATVPTTTTSTGATETTGDAGADLPTVSGGEPGLYGGTQDTSRCDPNQMASFLNDNPDKGRAWIQGINADPDFRWSGGDSLSVNDIPAFLSELTPVTLVADTRVTNNGYRDGVPIPRQAVLQAGTSVLVDTLGVPRAKCNCGNPLAPPIAQTAAVTYTGNRWDNFKPETTVVVQPSPAPLPAIRLVDLFTGELIDRPIGTTGTADVATGITLSNPLVDPTVIIATTSTTLVVASTTTVTGSTTLATTTSTTTPSVLSSDDFCTAWFEYVAIDDQYVEQYDDPNSVPEYREFVLAALTDLARLAPDWVRADWEWYRDEYVRNPDFFLEDAGTEAQESFARILEHLETDCGLDIFDEG